MKKKITVSIIAVLVLLSIAGGAVKINLINQTQRGIVLSEQELAENYCIQSSLWLPVGVTIGLSFLLFPKSFKVLVRGSGTLRNVLILIIGLALLLFTMRDFWRNCGFALRSFF